MPIHLFADVRGNRAACLGCFNFRGDVVHQFIASVTVGRIGFQQVLNHFLVGHCAVLRVGLSCNVFRETSSVFTATKKPALCNHAHTACSPIRHFSSAPSTDRF